MKICVLSLDPWLDRLHGASIVNLFNQLAGLGNQVEILIPSSRTVSQTSRSLTVRTLAQKKPIPGLSLLLFYKYSLKQLIASRPTVTIMDPILFPLQILFKRIYKVPSVTMILSRPVGKGWMQNITFRISLIAAKFFASKITAISPFEALEFMRMAKIPENKIFVLPSPLGDVFQLDGGVFEDMERFRIEHGLQSYVGYQILLYQGTLDEKRNILQLIDVFINCFGADSHVALLLVGNGPAKEMIKELIKHRDVKSVILMDAVPYATMPQLILACDYGLVILPDSPSWRYQCPTKLIEFLAMGKPVVGSNLPGIRWISGNSPCVSLIADLDSNAFRKAIEQLQANSQDCKSKRDEISKAAIQRFSSKNLSAELCQVLSLITTTNVRETDSTSESI